MQMQIDEVETKLVVHAFRESTTSHYPPNIDWTYIF